MKSPFFLKTTFYAFACISGLTLLQPREAMSQSSPDAGAKPQIPTLPRYTGSQSFASYPAIADTVKPQKPDSVKPAIYPRFVLYISPGIGGNVGKQHGQIQKSDITDVTSTSYVLNGVRAEHCGFDYDVGIQLTVISSKRLFLRAGVGIENIIYTGTAKGTVYHSTKGVVTDSTNEDWIYTYQDEFLQVPLSLSYRISEEGHNYMGINLGVTGSFLISETCSGVRTDPFSVKGQTGAFGSGGFVYIYRSKRPGEGSLSIEPEVKYMLNAMDDRRVFWTFGLKLGVAFGLNK
jgi:hypothetical protein